MISEVEADAIDQWFRKFQKERGIYSSRTSYRAQRLAREEYED